LRLALAGIRCGKISAHPPSQFRHVPAWDRVIAGKVQRSQSLNPKQWRNVLDQIVAKIQSAQSVETLEWGEIANAIFPQINKSQILKS